MFKNFHLGSCSLLLGFALSAVSVGGGSHAAESYMYSRVSNDFVDVGSIRYAFRKVGKTTGVPLVLLVHTSGNMDSWDPALVDALASQRLVIAFDNEGVGLSNERHRRPLRRRPTMLLSHTDGRLTRNSPRTRLGRHARVQIVREL